jgi:N-acyl homoserine lactone hydrolase
MTQVLKFWPLLTATHRYDKFFSIRNTGHGTTIEAPILAYLIETRRGRVVFDVGCDYHKLSTPAALVQWYGPDDFPMGPPHMDEEQRLPAHFARLELTPEDIDLVFLSHLHFDHAGGLYELCSAEVHVHEDEFYAARKPADNAYFASDFDGDDRWRLQQDDYDLIPRLRAIDTPSHTAGDMSLMIELPDGAPVILAGDAADLNENITVEIAHGFCWRGCGDLAVNSIRKLKKVAVETSAEL